MGNTGRDRRKYPRIATEQMIGVARVENAPAPVAGSLAHGRDFSTGGIRFEICGPEIVLGEVLRIYFNVEDETVSALGRVVWATELDSFTTEVGLEFVEIDPVASEWVERTARG